MGAYTTEYTKSTSKPIAPSTYFDVTTQTEKLVPGYTAPVDLVKGPINTTPTAEELNKSNFSIDPTVLSAQDTFAKFIQNRGAYVEQALKPYEERLFSGMAYTTPALERESVYQAIPQINQYIQDAQGVTNRAMSSSGMAFDNTEQKLNNRLNKLKQSETIGQAATTIKQRLRDRDLSVALGSGASAAYIPISQQIQ